MTKTFFLDILAPDFHDKINGMWKSLDGQDPLLRALIGPAHIDKCLVSLLENFLVQGATTKDKHLYSEASGILSSLYTRAEFTYMLGMITSKTLTNIKTICTVRNKFAHSHVELSFDSDEIAKLCKSLILRAPVFDDGRDPPSEWLEWQNEPENRFAQAVTDVILTLAELPAKLRRPNTPYIDGEPSQ